MPASRPLHPVVDLELQACIHFAFKVSATATAEGSGMEAEAPLQTPALVLSTQQQQPGEQTSGLQSTVRRASRSLCSPPAGPFAFDSHDLAWEEGTYASTRFLSVTIPSDRIQDFVSGENTRGQTSFCVFKSERPWKAEHVSLLLQTASFRCPSGFIIIVAL